MFNINQVGYHLSLSTSTPNIQLIPDFVLKADMAEITRLRSARLRDSAFPRALSFFRKLSSTPKPSRVLRRSFQGKLLWIDDLRDLPQILRALESDSGLAKNITAIKIIEKKSKRVLYHHGWCDRTRYEQSDIEMSKIIQEIQKEGAIESFTWGGDIACNNLRPLEFWESLWKATTTLKSLDMKLTRVEMSESPEFVRCHPPKPSSH